MDPKVNQISDHMFHLGKYLLGHGLEHTVFTNGHPYWHAMGIMHIAQSAEILIKAAIAKEHPLLIFTDLPKLSQIQENALSVEQLIEQGKTAQYSKLPDLLWASTGFEIKELGSYQEMGAERNKIQHLVVPDTDLSGRAVEFCIQVIDPIMYKFWGEHFLDDLVIDDPYIYEDDILKNAIEDTGLKYHGEIPSQ